MDLSWLKYQRKGENLYKEEIHCLYFSPVVVGTYTEGVETHDDMQQAHVKGKGRVVCIPEMKMYVRLVGKAPLFRNVILINHT